MLKVCDDLEDSANVAGTPLLSYQKSAWLIVGSSKKTSPKSKTGHYYWRPSIVFVLCVIIERVTSFSFLICQASTSDAMANNLAPPIL